MHASDKILENQLKITSTNYKCLANPSIIINWNIKFENYNSK